MKGKTIAKKTANALLCVLLIASLLLAVAMTVSKIANKPLFIFGKSAVWIVSESMEDTIPAKSFILVEKADSTQVSSGDVIMFRPENPGLKGGYNTHRLTITEDGRWITKGDNNAADDGVYSAKPENVVGKYVKNLTVLTALMRFFSTPAGIILFVAFLVALCVALFLPDVLKANKQKKEEARRKAEEAKEKLFRDELERLKNSASQNGEEQDQKSTGNKD